jgi:hypothetical protein
MPKASERPSTAAVVPSRMLTATLARAISTLNPRSLQAALGSELIRWKLPSQATTTP